MFSIQIPPCWLVLFFGVVSGMFLQPVYSADTRLIAGTVLDAETNQVLRGVSIEAEGALYGTITNNDGKFSLLLDPAKPQELILSRAGYEELRYPIGVEETLQIRLHPMKTPTATSSAMMAEADFTLGLIRKLLAATSWPDEAQHRTQPLVIGLIGNNPFGSDLFAFEQVQIKGRPAEIRFLSLPEEIAAVNALIVCRATPALVRAIEPHLAGKPVVSFFYQCSQQVPDAGLFRIEPANGHIIYRLNTSAVKSTGLSFAQVVYQLATP